MIRNEVLNQQIRKISTIYLRTEIGHEQMKKETLNCGRYCSCQSEEIYVTEMSRLLKIQVSTEARSHSWFPVH